VSHVGPPDAVGRASTAEPDPASSGLVAGAGGISSRSSALIALIAKSIEVVCIDPHAGLCRPMRQAGKMRRACGSAYRPPASKIGSAPMPHMGDSLDRPSGVVRRQSGLGGGPRHPSDHPEDETSSPAADHFRTNCAVRSDDAPFHDAPLKSARREPSFCRLLNPFRGTIQVQSVHSKNHSARAVHAMTSECDKLRRRRRPTARARRTGRRPTQGVDESARFHTRQKRVPVLIP